MANEDRGPSPPTERVLAILGLLAATPERGYTLSEIAAGLDLSIATCHAITSVLVDHGYLLRSAVTKTFTLGPALVTMGDAAGRAVPAALIARSMVPTLAAALGVETVASVVADGTITVVEWTPGPTGAPVAGPGQRVPFDPPFGAVHAAWAADAVREGWLSRAPRSARAGLLGLLATVRERGFDVHRNDAAAELFRQALGQLGDGDLSVEARRAAAVIQRELAGASALPARFDGRRRYAVNTISAAVLDGEVPVLTLSLLYHRDLTGREIEHAGAALVSAARGDAYSRTA